MTILKSDETVEKIKTSYENNVFKQNISKEIWDKKYRNGNETYAEYCTRIASTLANTENEFEQLHNLLFNQYVSFGGRIMYGVGTGKQNITFSNCYVMPIERDSMDAIIEAVKKAALTMKAGGGVGYNFSILRPKGATINTTGGISSGVISFMSIFDSACATILSGNSRRGAQMGILDVWHPEVEDFIIAKRNGGLSNFNISVGIYDAFMDAVDKDGDWHLEFPDYEKCPNEYNTIWDGNLGNWKAMGLPTKIYKTVKAKELYDKIIKSNYDFAEPGVVFIDTINKYNNLNYCEFINATNPCGEQPLVAYGSCNLASINLAKLVENPFADDTTINYNLLVKCVKALVRGLDKVLDINYYPIIEQALEVENKRQIGIGITGLGDMLAMLGIKYSSKEGVQKAEDVMKFIANRAYYESAMLAKAKGHFPYYDSEKILQSEFVKKLDDDVKEAIAKYGLRNSRLLSIAPTGTISLVMNNVSSGIEPIFSLEYTRKIRNIDNTYSEQKVKDYAWLMYEKITGNTEKPDFFETALEIDVDTHLNMQSALQKWVDTSISKTINIPADYDYEDFKQVYKKAHVLELKGCTTYRPNNIVGSILSTDTKEPNTKDDEVFKKKELDDIEHAKRHRITWKNGTKVYVNVSVDKQNTPIEIFAKLPKKAGFGSDDLFDPALYLDRQSDWEFICRLQSKLLRIGYPLSEIIDDAEKSAFTMHSLPALMARILNEYVSKLSDDEKEQIKQNKTGMICPECGEQTLVKEQGCNKCLECGYSKCS